MMQAPRAPAAFAWLQAIAAPELALRWPLAEWQRVIRLSRRLRLLARLAESMQRTGIEATLPGPVQRHLVAERRRSRARLRALNWMVEQVGGVLRDLDCPCVLLKGAAYAAQGLPVAAGRLPSDLDILVPRMDLAAAQRRLKDHDWQEAILDAHDQRYYREWSHELPPMQHARFELELDLHHGILPPVASTTVDPARLLERLLPAGIPGWSVFCPADQVLHSAAHLFLDSELRDRVRDLVDLDGLMRHFACRHGFWDDLVDRSIELGLVEPLALAVHYTMAWLGTPVPEPVRRRTDRLGPGPAKQAWLLPLLDAVLWPSEPDAPEPWSQRLAAVALLSRHHWNRMPLHLLLPHLWHKSRTRRVRPLEGDDDA